MPVASASPSPQEPGPFESGLERVLDELGYAFCILDREWRFRFYNQAAEALSGISRKEVLGRSIWDVSPHVIGTPLEAALRRVMMDRVRLEREFVAAVRPGVRYCVNAFPLEVGLGIIFRDVTSVHETRLREREHAERLELAFEASGLGEWSWEAGSDQVNLSERAAAILGVPPRPGLSWRAIQDRLHPDDAQRVGEGVQAALDEGSPYESEFRVVTADRGEVWIMARARAQYGPDRRPISMLGVIGDVTQSKQREARQRESEARFRVMADGAPCPIWVTDELGNIEFVNRATVEFSGQQRDESTAEIMAKRLHPDDRAELGRIRAEAQASHAPYGMEGRFLDALGRWRWSRIVARPRFDHEGAFVGYVGMSMDITEIREAEARQRLLINELNHRVKNTLATVQSVANQTLREETSPELARHTFIDRLLALSAVHNVLTRENWEGANLLEIATEAVRPYETTAGSRIQLQGRDARLNPQVAVGLSMALHELATNASKYGALSRPEGRVALAWRVRGAEILLMWCERGGPPVQAPIRRGFGTRLLTRGLAIELGRPAQLHYRKSGLVCFLRAPVAQA